jgi:hypothetical protein
MNLKYQTALILSTVNFLFANSELSTVNFEVSDGKIIPNFIYPIYWKDDLFSTIGYLNYIDMKSKDIDYGKTSSSYEEQQIYINILSKKYKFDNYSFSIGANANLIKFKNSEFGFINHLKNMTVIDNRVDIDVTQFGFSANFSKSINNWLFFRISGDIYPSSNIYFEQTTTSLIDNKKAIYSGSASANTSYSALFELTAKTDLPIFFGLEASYDFFALKYKFIDANFNLQDFNGEIETTHILFKTIINYKIFGEMNPSIGIGRRNIKNRNLLENSFENINEKIWRIGAEKRF